MGGCVCIRARFCIRTKGGGYNTALGVFDANQNSLCLDPPLN